MKTRWKLALAGAPLLVAALLGCNSDSDEQMLSENAVVDFGLQDVNPNSATSGTTVSVRDHVGSVSAWYFAHAT